ncbi:hypothetical protein [Phyllobacterium myrsinacearum]|uniref:Uncharacterized protein n=1 Tax=Phyllobacterium myrsinacearum TaxID=28101 RepID=A0A839ELS8_9HYPH|nr:hypothetical protein [Phyllobacterium myrsinacearum]MBA8878444.1 hypothetical protein [Phyllobacterium myrsinacearum]
MAVSRKAEAAVAIASHAFAGPFWHLFPVRMSSRNRPETAQAGAFDGSRSEAAIAGVREALACYFQ